MKSESEKCGRRAWLWLMIAAACVLLAGCGANESHTFNAASGSLSADESGAASSASNSAAGAGAPSSSQKATGATGNSALSTLVQSAATTPRKIIYTANLDLVVENLSTAQVSLARLVRANHGYIAETDVGGQSGSQRSGTWKVRVPVENYEAFMAGATRLGELQTTHSNSQDVTAEYYDVAARIGNKQVEEKRLLRHLEVSTGKLNEILQVERELSRVRGEIEELQGRIRVLANLSSLTTITLALHEIKNYVPPKPTTFGSEVARQFSASLRALSETGKALILVLVTLAPWLVLAALFGLPARSWWRRRNARPDPPPRSDSVPPRPPDRKPL